MVPSQHKLPRQSDSREMPQASPSDTATRSSCDYFAHIVKVKFAPTHLLTILIKACLPPQQLLGKQMWQQPCAYYFSKTSAFLRRFRHIFSALTYVFLRLTSSLANHSNHLITHLISAISAKFSTKSCISANP